MNTKHQTQAIEKQAQAIREIREELVSELNEVVGRFDKDDMFVSTARVSDGRQPYETAVKHPEYNDGSMVIVEAYDTKSDAAAGHERWVNTMNTNPLPEFLRDCRNSELAKMCEALGKDEAEWTHYRKQG